MLAEKLAQAKQAKQKKTVTIIAVISGVALVAALLLFVSSNYRLIGIDEIVAPSSKPFTIMPENRSPTPDSVAIESVSALRPAESNETDGAGRQVYLDLYSQYQNEVMPGLSMIDIDSWDKPLADRLAFYENNAVSAFASGNYLDAQKGMTELIALSQDTIQRSQGEFETLIQKAKDAYIDRNYDLASLLVQKALMHNAGSQDAQLLSQKIAQIPEILSIEEAIRVARVENNPSKEIVLTKKLLELNPTQTDLKARLASLQSQLADKRFNQHIANAYQAIESREVKTAKAELSGAKAITPSRQEIVQVSESLAELESQLRYESSQSSALSAQQKDDWEGAVTSLQAALKEAPADKALVERHETAKQIVALKQQMQGLLAHPYRLAVEVVKTRANIALIKSAPLLDESASLKSLAQKLKTTVEAVNTPVSVKVISDGQTSVSVRSVGVVGQTQSKVIPLKPGEYTFEGKRDGYKSKILAVTVPMDKPSYQVTVIADERI